MQQHPIDTMMQTTMEHIRSMVDVNTVVGAPVAGAKGTTIIPMITVLIISMRPTTICAPPTCTSWPMP